jgi:hypothetical protein
VVPEDFEAFVGARGPALLRLAVMLTGEPHAAEDLVQTALAKAYRHWARGLHQPLRCIAGRRFPTTQALVKAMFSPLNGGWAFSGPLPVE